MTQSFYFRIEWDCIGLFEVSCLRMNELSHVLNHRRSGKLRCLDFQNRALFLSNCQFMIAVQNSLLGIATFL